MRVHTSLACIPSLTAQQYRLPVKAPGDVKKRQPPVKVENDVHLKEVAKKE